VMSPKTCDSVNSKATEVGRYRQWTILSGRLNVFYLLGTDKAHGA